MTDAAVPGAAAADPSVVVFDGVCNLCHAWVSFLLAHDHQRRFRFATLQSTTGRSLVDRAAPQFRRVDSIVLIEEGRAYARSAAALRILQRLGFPWAVAGILRIVPPLIRDAVYDVIARNRYRWFGRTTACRLPTPEERTLFLD